MYCLDISERAPSDLVTPTLHPILNLYNLYPLEHFNDTEILQSNAKSTPFSWNKKCRKDSELRFIIMPYTFPLLIEFNVMASTLALAIWDNCGHGLISPKEGDDDIVDEEGRKREVSSLRTRNPSLATIQFDAITLEGPSLDSPAFGRDNNSSVFDPSSDSVSGKDHANKYQYNKKGGFILGWITICGAVGLVIVCLYIMYSVDGTALNIEYTIYGANLALSALSLVIIPLTMNRMSTLTFRDDEIKFLLKMKHDKGTQFKHSNNHKLDNYLLIVTLLALFAFKIFSAIAAIEQESYLVLVDSIICMLTSLVQTFFIIYAQNKRSKTEQHLKTRPGRQGLEFLRCINFALWLINTFLLKHPEAKRVQNSTYGYLPWSILSNTFQPLTILYYFHTVVCIAEIIRRAYTAKFVGLVRPSKRRNSTVIRSLVNEYNITSDL